MMMKRPSGSSARAVAMARVTRSNAASSLTRAAAFAAKPASQVTVTGLLPNAVPGPDSSAGQFAAVDSGRFKRVSAAIGHDVHFRNSATVKRGHRLFATGLRFNSAESDRLAATPDAELHGSNS
jgi:multidrug efflux system membrane fusion protein